MVLAKNPPKVKLDNFHNSRVLELRELCVPQFVRVLGFLQQHGIDICFLAQKILPGGRDLICFIYFTRSFPYRTLLVRVKRGAQDIFSYTYAWKPSKATLASSRVRLSSSASLRQLHIPSIYSSRLVQLFCCPQGVAVSF